MMQISRVLPSDGATLTKWQAEEIIRTATQDRLDIAIAHNGKFLVRDKAMPTRAGNRRIEVLGRIVERDEQSNLETGDEALAIFKDPELRKRAEAINERIKREVQ